MRCLPLLLVLLLPVSAACDGDPVRMHQPPVRFELAAESVEIPLKQVDGRVIIDVMLDGRGPFPFILDTGAQGGVMDLAFAREQGLALGQEVTVASPGGGGRPGRQVTIGTARIGGLTLHDLTTIAFEGLPFPKDADSPRGVLGPYSLDGLLITLDYPRQVIVFRRGALPEPDEREVFGWKRNQRLPEIPATVAGLPVVVHLDSGASGALSLPTAFADRLPLDGPLRDMGYAKTIDQVKPLRGAAVQGALALGRYTIENPTVRFVDMAQGVGNVGAAILGRFALTIDPANARLMLSGPADGRVQVMDAPMPRYGVQLRALDADPLEVVVVDAGSPAEKSGLRAGDRIVRMNGRPVEELSSDERLAALKAPALELTVRRGEGDLVLAMALE